MQDCGQSIESEHQYGVWLRESMAVRQFGTEGMELRSVRGVNLGSERVVRTAPKAEGGQRGIRIFDPGRQVEIAGGGETDVHRRSGRTIERDNVVSDKHGWEGGCASMGDDQIPSHYIDTENPQNNLVLGETSVPAPCSTLSSPMSQSGDSLEMLIPVLIEFKAGRYSRMWFSRQG
ncbi:UNVERIFIED_CONTAM: hypothetical protein Sradi_3842600 [Sesamum radiatum]|uniref:Uncharacterized protein n=1 Tax=Sesamum radiatum TaxID=300843 RepID=A0AAW2Q1L0_SESRA